MGWQARLHSFLSLPIANIRGCWTPIFVIASIAIHILVFHGTLNIHFTSPIVGNVPKVHKPNLDSVLARRVVLFVIDGLRARSLYKDRLKTAPFLRDIVLNRGAWGISHARTPTLSRPGHLSLVSGVYEYMHGLTRPPSENPFDSIFNRSNFAWVLGEHEIVRMFINPQSSGRIHTWHYPPATNDFSMRNPSLLDNLVFQHLRQFLHNATTDAQLGQKVNSRAVVFMCHLLGVDTFSHSHATSGRGLEEVISAVDEGIRQTEAEFERYYNHDGRTAYILSADHGMADWSGHGAGNNLDEVRTPLLAWGAGIRRPEIAETDQGWGISTRRCDIAQVDICPLMAALLGTVFPSHSVGRVPLKLLNMSLSEKAHLLRANALQMLEQFKILRQRRKRYSLRLLFQEYEHLTPAAAEAWLRIADAAFAGGNIHEALVGYDNLLKTSVAGLNYFHHYYKHFTEICMISILCATIISCLLSAINVQQALQETTVTCCEVLIFLSAGLLIGLFLLIDSRPWLHSIYLYLLLYLVWAIYRNLGLLRSLDVSLGDLKQLAYTGIGVCLLVLLFYHRWVAGLATIAHTVWDIAHVEPEMRMSKSARIFIFNSIALIFYPMMRILGHAVSFVQVYTGPLLTIGVTGLLLRRQARNSTSCTRLIALVISCQVFMLVCSCLNHYRTHASILNGDGMPVGATLVTKLLLIASFILILVVKRCGTVDMTLLSVWLAVVTIMTLFSLSFEPLAVTITAIALGAWLAMHKGYAVPHYCLPWPDKSLLGVSSSSSSNNGGSVGGEHPDKRSIDVRSIYHAYAFTLYMYLSTYSIGNMPSISSYDPHTVLCFQGVFDLGVMAMVVFLKDVLPIVLIICHLIVLMNDLSAIQVYRKIIIFTDLITLYFLIIIRSPDNWIDYATRINYFTLSMLFIAFVSSVFPICRIFVCYGRS